MNNSTEFNIESLLNKTTLGNMRQKKGLLGSFFL